MSAHHKPFTPGDKTTNFLPGRSLRRGFLGALASLTTLTASDAAFAQTAPWPTKTIRIVVGFAPGGTTDVTARMLAQALTEAMGQTVVVDNKPGASGNIAAGEVAKATPDGYTVMVAPTSVETANPSLFKSTLLPSRDLSPVMAIGRTQMYLITRPGLEVKDATQLIAMAKAGPGRLSYASAGTGTPPQLAGELFKQSTGTFITHIPYRGAAPALQDVMASQTDMAFDPGIAFPHIRSGKVKLLAVASDKKSPFFPDVPTYADLGIKDAGLDIWFGLWVPNNTPAEVTARLGREIGKALPEAALWRPGCRAGGAGDGRLQEAAGAGRQDAVYADQRPQDHRRMSQAPILAETIGRVGLVTLNRPKQLNALNDALMDALGKQLLAFDTDDGIGAIVITGGDKAFAAGADIAAMVDWTCMDVYRSDFISRNWETIRRVRKPVIAAVAGFAMGGGCELALACDIVIAAESAKFALPEIKLAMLPGAGGTQRLPRAIGKAKAMDMCLSARMLDAAEADRCGLVSRVVPDAQLRAQSLALAARLAGFSLPALMAIKESVNRAFEGALSEGITFERRQLHARFASDDAHEGMRAFLDKRAPVFTHR